MQCPKCNASVGEEEDICKACGNPLYIPGFEGEPEVEEKLKEMHEEQVMQVNVQNPSNGNIQNIQSVDENGQPVQVYTNEEIDPQYELQQNKHKGIHIGKVILILVSVLILTGAGIGTYIVLDKTMNKPSEAPIVTEEKEVVKQKLTSNGVIFDGYELPLAEGYSYTVYSGDVFVYNAEKSLTVRIKKSPISYQTFIAKRESLRPALLAQGVTVNAGPDEKAYNGRNYIVLNVTKQSNNEIVAITKASESEALVITVQSINNVVNYEQLNEVTKILSDIKYVANDTVKGLRLDNVVNSESLINSLK